MTNPQAGGQPLSFVRGCLFNIFAATSTLHTWRPFLYPKPEHAKCCDRGPHNMDAKRIPGIFLSSSLENIQRVNPFEHKMRWHKYCISDVSFPLSVICARNGGTISVESFSFFEKSRWFNAIWVIFLYKRVKLKHYCHLSSRKKVQIDILP
jgi:hypothetical protein